MDLNQIITKALAQQLLVAEELQFIITGVNTLPEIYAGATQIREKYHGNNIRLCQIINAKSGRCTEDCAFCAQSVHHHTEVSEYGWVGGVPIEEAAITAKAHGAHLGIVTSGRSMQQMRSRQRVLDDIASVAEKYEIHASLGTLSSEEAIALKQTGVTCYHHNLETAPSHYSKIVSTHTFAERVRTVLNAKAAGLKVCCGGIFGIGESAEQIVEFALTLRELGVNSIPLNFLYPVPGTPLENAVKLETDYILRIIAMFRFCFPDRDIRVCGGREYNLGDRQKEIFSAGANGVMIGNYLTVRGRAVEDDLKMIKELGLNIECASHMA